MKITLKRYHLLLTILIIFTLSCKERAFFQKLESALQNTKQLLRIEDLFPQDWDEVLILHTGDSSWIWHCPEAEKILGRKYEPLDERQIRFIFSKAGKTVQKFEHSKSYEAENFYPYFLPCSENFSGLQRINIYKRSQAIFKLERHEAVPTCFRKKMSGQDTMDLCH